VSFLLRFLLAIFIVAQVSSVCAQQRRAPVTSLEPIRYTTPTQGAAVVAALPQGAVVEAFPKSLLVDVPFADAGFPDGFRLSNLGGRRALYIPVP
jgi:hypothetical protein